MKKEKLSYFVLLAEVLVIIYLHSTKTPSSALPEHERQVAGKAQPTTQPAKTVHHAVFTLR